MIPKHAKKVFTGVIYDVYHWEQEIFDGTTRTWEMLKRPDSSTILALVGEKFMVLDEEQPHHGKHLGLPGGIVDEGETPLEAAKRELLEETGYTSTQWVEFAKLHPGFKTEWTDHIFLAKDCKKTADATPEPGEKIEVKLFTKEEFKELLLHKDFRNKLVALELLRMRKEGTSLI